MNRVELMKKVRDMAGEENWIRRSRTASELIEEMHEVFDRLQELEMREDRNDYLTKQLHLQQRINAELEYNLSDEHCLLDRLEEVRKG